MSEEAKKIVESLSLPELAGFLRGVGSWTSLAVPQKGLPSFRVSDGPCGLRREKDGKAMFHDSETSTLLPCSTLLASSFDRALAKTYGGLLGRQAQALQVDVLLGPAINIQRDPRGGRNFEYMSEDPLLAGTMAASYVEGVQETGTMACVKHFAVNSQEERRMNVDEVVDERALREIYLRAFEIAVEQAKPATVMASYNKVNGVHATENGHLLKALLRDEFGFDGMVMSDWFAVDDPVLSIRNGLDLEMPQGNDSNKPAILRNLERNPAFLKDAKRAAERIVDIALRAQHGERKDIDLEKGHEDAISIACGGIVLLKNESSLLPLSEEDDFAVIGELAKNPRIQGGGSSHVHPYRIESFLDLVRKDVDYARGYDLENIQDESFLAEAVALAKKHKKVLLFLGVPEKEESEGYDRTSLDLPAVMRKLARDVLLACPDTVVILENGGPLVLPFAKDCKAILEAFLSGEGTNAAVKKVLFGEANPSGHLSETFPLALEDVPSYGDFATGADHSLHRESVYVGYRYYLSCKKAVLFPFGHGLSYTTFAFHGLKVEDDGKDIVVTYEVTNTGEREGKAVPQVYVHRPDRSLFMPRLELAAFAKVDLKPGETRTVRQTIDRHLLSAYDVPSGTTLPLFGTFEIALGHSALEIDERAFLERKGEDGFSTQDRERLSWYYDPKGDTKPDDRSFFELLGREVDLAPEKGITWDTTMAEAAKRSKGAKAFVSLVTRFEPLKSDRFMREGFLSSPLRVVCYNDKSLAKNRDKLMKAMTARFYPLPLLALLLSLMKTMREYK